MIPLRDDAGLRRFPAANLSLLLLCGAVFLWELALGSDVESAIHDYGLIPARLLSLAARSSLADPAPYLPLVTALFLHADAAHFGVNMVFLWVFGGGVEERLGHAGHFAFFALGGTFASLVHVAMHPASLVPTVGASGAIAAVMGAYLVLHPRARILSFVPPVFWIQFRVPAPAWLGLWWIVQLVMGTAALAGDQRAAGVAWWTHAGGFAFGLAALAMLGRR